MIEVELPDGSIAEFPDGTSPDVMRNALRRRFPAPVTAAPSGLFDESIPAPVAPAASVDGAGPALSATAPEGPSFRASTLDNTPVTLGDRFADLRARARAGASSGAAGLIETPGRLISAIQGLGLLLAPDEAERVERGEAARFQQPEIVQRLAAGLREQEALRREEISPRAAVEEEVRNKALAKGFLPVLQFLFENPAAAGAEGADLAGRVLASGIIPGSTGGAALLQGLGAGSTAAAEVEDTLRARGLDEATIRDRSDLTFAGSAVANTLFSFLFPGGLAVERAILSGQAGRQVAGSTAARLLTPAIGEPVSEGAAEFLDQVVQNLATDRPALENAPGAAGLGFALGAPGGLAAGTADVLAGRQVAPRSAGQGDLTRGDVGPRADNLTDINRQAAADQGVDLDAVLAAVDRQLLANTGEAAPTAPAAPNAPPPAERPSNPSLPDEDVPAAAPLTPEQAARQPPPGERIAARAVPDEPAAGAELRQRLTTDFGGAVAEYSALSGEFDSRDGTILNTDLARELSPVYRADRTRSAEVHEAASDFVKELYAEKLAAPTPEGADRLVRFTAGGTGAGKTSALRALGNQQLQPEIVFDTNMSTFDSALGKVQQAIRAGRDVEIVYTFRDPVEALVEGAVTRARRMASEQGTGRTVPIEEHAKTHIGAARVVRQLQQRFKGNPRVRIIAIDNSRGRGNQAVVPLESLPQVEENGLRERLRAEIERLHSEGRLTDAQRDGFFGRSAIDAGGEGGTQAQSGRPDSGDGRVAAPGVAAQRPASGRQGTVAGTSPAESTAGLPSSRDRDADSATDAAGPEGQVAGTAFARRPGAADGDLFGGATPAPPATRAAASAPAVRQPGLLPEPTAQERNAAAAQQRDAERNGLGRDVVRPEQGEGDLLAGPRPEQARIDDAQPSTEQTAEPAPAPRDTGEAGLSRRDGRPAAVREPAISEQEVRAVIDDVTALWDADIPVDSVATFADLPPQARAEAQRQGSDGSDIVAVFHNGGILLVRDHPDLSTRANIERALFHEGYGHLGLRRLLGEARGREMIRMADALGGLPGIRRFAQQRGIDIEPYFQGTAGQPRGQRMITMMDELLAAIAENPPAPGIGQRARELLGAIRRWLRNHGFSRLARGLTDADIAVLMRDARRAVLQDRGLSDQQGTFFMRDQRPRQPAGTDEATGLPLNDDGTVTVFHHTDSAAAQRIIETGRLQSAGEPDVFVTTAREPIGFGDTVVPVRIRPDQLILDDEFPGGRRDFRIETGRPGGSVAVRVDDSGAITNDRTGREADDSAPAGSSPLARGTERL